ncbi:hypothetical protein CMI47_22625 [Candidatus Pacearchaeota archaeon]|jgi:hypothetical protein|nr:hypothetical protein [Candidatus Pacearchaeota archaeon]|tara:strand:+ start:307 stop:783 length:477 start_codon:yes stop_codon:yes gene_type:complete
MNKKRFINIIERIVEKKVKEELPKQLKEIFIKEDFKDETVDLKSLSKEFNPPDDSEIKEEVTYSNNETINKILNETKGGITKPGFEEYPTLGGGSFDTNRVGELMGYGKSDEGKREMGAVDTIRKAGVNVEDVPDHVQNALTRDYSEVMKAIDNKKGK